MDSQNLEKEIIKEEREILKKEGEILREIKTEEKTILRLNKRFLMIAGIVGFSIIAAGGGLIYWVAVHGRVAIDKAEISAPKIDLASSFPGALEEVFVREGDVVLADTPVARVGNQLIKTTTGGMIIAVNNDIGKIFNPSEPIVSMIDPKELRVVGRVPEDKGLSSLRVGQSAKFTVDAFGGRTYYGVVDEISPTSRDSGIVFNISDKRETREFEVRVRFSADAYPELRNGMSAKLWIYQN